MESLQLKPGAVPQYQEVFGRVEGSDHHERWDIDQAAGNESIGYPTQKPLALLERIIKRQQQRRRHGARPVLRMRHGLRSGRPTKPASGPASTFRRWRRSWCGSAFRRRGRCCTTSSTAPTFPSAPTSAHCRPTAHTSTHCSANRRASATAAKSSSPFATSPWTTSSPRPRRLRPYRQLQLLCGACNSAKGSGTQAELIAKLQALDHHPEAVD